MIFIFCSVFGTWCVFSTYRTSQFGLASFHVFSRHEWLVATAVDHTEQSAYSSAGHMVTVLQRLSSIFLSKYVSSLSVLSLSTDTP